MTKFKKIQEENILIPKKQGGQEEEKTQVQADDPNQLLTAHLQEEVRKLHFQLNNKDQIIKEIKRVHEANAGEADSTKLMQLLKSDSEVERSTQ